MSDRGTGWGRSLVLATLLLAMNGCGPPGTPRDRELAEDIRRIHAQRIELTLEDDLYVRAKLRIDPLVSDAEMEQVYREFFFEADGRRRETDYVYLNVYDQGGRFLFQLYHDPGRVPVYS